MGIKVQFDKNGFYHPAFGRLGRGDKDRNKVYELPDGFAEPGKLPTTARIIESKEALEEILEEEEQAKPVKPKIVDEEALEKSIAPGAGRRLKSDSAQKRTTGSTRSSGSSKRKLN